MNNMLYELCSCNSGKKLKFCCKKQKESGKSIVRVFTYQITSEPIRNIKDEYNISEKDHEAFEQATVDLSKKKSFFFVKRSLRSTTKTFEMLVEKYPHVPHFMYNLAMTYEIIDETDKAYSLLDTVYTKFPDYLFGKIAKASLLLGNKQFDKIPAVFNNSFVLSDVCSGRKVFHVSEFLAFHTCIMEYFVKINRMDNAKVCYQYIEKIDPENELLTPYKAIFKKYDERSADSSRKYGWFYEPKSKE